MSTLRYAGACAVVVGLGVLVTAALLDGRALAGVLAAGAVALPIQITAFALMARARVGSNAFLAAWIGGTLARLVVVGLVGWGLVSLPELSPAPTLLGLVAFFFVMVLLEPPFLGLVLIERCSIRGVDEPLGLDPRTGSRDDGGRPGESGRTHHAPPHGRARA